MEPIERKATRAGDGTWRVDNLVVPRQHSAKSSSMKLELSIKESVSLGGLLMVESVSKLKPA